MTPKQVEKELNNIINTYLMKDKNGEYILSTNYRLPVYLEGAAGIGKSQLAEAVCRDCGIGFVSFNLCHNTRSNILGLPSLKSNVSGEQFTEFSMSELIASVRNNGSDEGVLFLDEFPCMADSVAPLMLSFLQNKRIGQYSLPDGWIIFLAGNDVTHNRSARPIDAATMDRIRKIKMEYSFDEYIEFGKKDGLIPIIIDYLEGHPENLYRVDKASNEVVTCRGWSSLSKVMSIYIEKGYEITQEFIFEFIKSESVSKSFYNYFVEVNRGINIDTLIDICQGKIGKNYITEVKALPYSEKWKVANRLIEFCIRAMNQELKDAHPMDNKLIEWLERANDFLNAIDSEGGFSARYIDAINKNEGSLEYVGCHDNLEFYHKAMAKYFHIA